MLYLTSDLHLGHGKIITYCKRPFATVDEMNATIVKNWNETISDGDTVWFLGDFCWKGYEHFFHQLNGEKHLIIGNHDSHGVLTLPWASQPSHYQELKVTDENTAIKLVLSHYGMRSWHGMYKKSIMLYGHSHNTLPGFRLSSGGGTMDVGVDCWDFRPVTVSQIRSRLATLPEFAPEIHDTKK